MYKRITILFCLQLLFSWVSPAEGQPSADGSAQAPAQNEPQPVNVATVKGNDKVGYVDRDEVIKNFKVARQKSQEVQDAEVAFRKSVEDCNKTYAEQKSKGLTDEQLADWRNQVQKSIDDSTEVFRQKAGAIEKELEDLLTAAIVDECKSKKLKGFCFEASQKRKCVDITSGVIARVN